MDCSTVWFLLFFASSRRLNILYNSNLTTNATNLMNAPLYLARSGYINNGSIYSAGNNGDYWSSTVSDSGYACNLNFRSGSINPNVSSYRHLGFSLRCVLREP